MENVSVEKDAIWARLKQADPKLERTVGILTKPDLIPTGEHIEALRILTDNTEEMEDLRPAQGIFVVANPTTEQLQRGNYEKDPDLFEKHEKSIYTNTHFNKYFQQYKENFGFEFAKTRIIQVSTQLIAQKLPQWRSALSEALNSLQRKLDDISPSHENKSLSAQERVSKALHTLWEKMQDSIRSSSTGVSDRYQQNTALWNSITAKVLDPLEKLMSDTCPVFCLHRARAKTPNYGLDDLLEIMNIADGAEFGVQFSTRAVLDINSQTMERREDEIRKLVTRASGLITRHISDQIDSCMNEFPSLKTTCSNSLIQVIHQKERQVQDEIKKVVSHFHKAVPARRRQILERTQVFETLLFKKMKTPAEWEENPSDPKEKEQRRKVRKPSPLAQFTKNYKNSLREALNKLKKERKKRVSAEDVFDAGCEFWKDEESTEIYYFLHNLVSKMNCDKNRTCTVDDLQKRLKIVLDVDEDKSESEEESAGEEEEKDKEKDDKKDGELPPGWQEIKDDNGRTYFWNKQTDETTWNRPKAKTGPNKKGRKRGAKIGGEKMMSNRSLQAGDNANIGRRRTKAFLGDEDSTGLIGEEDLIQLDISFAKEQRGSKTHVLNTRLGLPCYFMPLATVPEPSIPIPEGLAMFFPDTKMESRQSVHFPLLNDRIPSQKRLGSFMAFTAAYLFDRDNGMVHELVNVILSTLLYKLPVTFQRDVEKAVGIHALTEEKLWNYYPKINVHWPNEMY
eukprot:UN32852